ncbi:MarR family transcriptional regulator [Irregularibacter muris]|uniref:MarR family transcriptional regulator n=1 Tax=Irregularibacter muris TaxID=1796619 RepID=A0AAE3HDV3_9FIRM|nr:MarR family transcriptional regulator [Irregularibacter muris]MCR1897424.1 MarR family transcriptional regulator [Irregularibacter muris]
MDRDSLYYIFLEILKLHHCRTHVLLDEIGIYPGQPPLLFILNKENGQSQKDLADKLKIAPATITVMVKRMEKANLVERKQDAKDQRISRVYLTDKGKEICKRSMKAMEHIEEECFGNFTVEEKVILRRLLMQMLDNLMRANSKQLM